MAAQRSPYNAVLYAPSTSYVLLYPLKVEMLSNVHFSNLGVNYPCQNYSCPHTQINLF